MMRAAIAKASFATPSTGERWMQRVGLLSILLLALVSPVCFGLTPALGEGSESGTREASAITNVNAALAMARAKLGSDAPSEGWITCSIVRTELTGSGVYAFFIGTRPTNLGALEAICPGARGQPVEAARGCARVLDSLTTVVLHC